MKKEEKKFSNEFKSVITGCLLGDGGMRIYKRGKNPSFNYTDKHLEFITYIKELFERNNIKCSRVYTSNSTGCFSFQTECLKEFLPFYDLFYSDKTKKQMRKVLPDIILDSIMLKLWYIGDGSIKKQFQTLNNACQISCKYNNKLILNQFKVLFHPNCNWYPYKTCGVFYIPHKGFQKLLDFIGECPINCYKYKWEIKRCSTTIINES